MVSTVDISLAATYDCCRAENKHDGPLFK
jgi:hypothetical protein